MEAASLPGKDPGLPAETGAIESNKTRASAALFMTRRLIPGCVRAHAAAIEVCENFVKCC